MRKIDVFGRKINQAKPLYIIILVFVLVISGYYAITQYQSNKLLQLEQQEEELQTEIDTLLNSNEQESYHEIGEIIQYLPNTYNQGRIVNDLNYVRNVSGLALATGYQVSFTPTTESPFTETLPQTIKFVRITISMTIEDPLLIIDYIENLIDQDQIYYIEHLSVSYLSDGSATIELEIFSFYNDIIV